MSDVPSTAMLMGVLAGCLRRNKMGDLLAGMSAGLAILTRPNLLVMVAPIAATLLMNREARAGRFARLVAAASPFVIALAWLNTDRYGGPLASGYGDTGRLFAAAHIWPNLLRYPRWLVDTQTPFILLALWAPVWAYRRDRITFAHTIAALVAAALLVVTYLSYVVFDDWWYIRFLLPMLPMLLVLSVAVGRGAVRSVKCGWSLRAVAVFFAALACWYLHVAQTRGAFALQSIEARFLATGTYASRALPRNAVVLAVQQSGSIRYHGGRSTLTWDVIDPSALDEVIAWLLASGRHPYIALEDTEEPRFRRRFNGERFGALDWPAGVEIHARVRVRVYDPDRRDPYRIGEPINIEHIR